MPDEALQHVAGVYKGDSLHMREVPLSRYDLLKAHRYFNKTFIQTASACHHACALCAEHTMYGLTFRFNPVDNVLRDIDACGDELITIGDADFFGVKARAIQMMKTFKGRGIRWQAGVNTAGAMDDRLLDLAAESGCFQLCIGFESVNKSTLRSVHKYQNKPEHYQALIDNVHSRGMMVLGFPCLDLKTTGQMCSMIQPNLQSTQSMTVVRFQYSHLFRAR